MIILNDELKKLLDDAHPWSTTRERLTFVYWDIFVPSKRDKLIEGLKIGKSWMFAFRDAKELNK